MASTALSRNYVQTTGRSDGPVLLFAHGFGCDQNMWQRMVPAFSETHRVVLFDHVGAGRSDLGAYDPKKYSSLDGYAQDVIEICDELNLSNVTSGCSSRATAVTSEGVAGQYSTRRLTGGAIRSAVAGRPQYQTPGSPGRRA